MEKMTIEQIIWRSIKDIENGIAKTIKEDPVNGLLPLNRKLTKKNISAQSAKYNYLNDYRPISRPTIDSFKDICDYLNAHDASFDYLKKIKELEKINNALVQKNKKNEEFIEKILNENYRLNELSKPLVKKRKF